MNAAAASSSCVNYNLRKASLIVSKVYAREMRGAPVRGRQFGLLMQIAKRPNLAITELARVVGADRTTMTRNLGQLRKKGFIRIGQGKDLRTKTVDLTRPGKVAIDRSISAWKKAQSVVLETLGDQRWARVLNDLSVLSALAGRP